MFSDLWPLSCLSLLLWRDRYDWGLSMIQSTSQQTWYVDPMLAQCRASVRDSGSILTQHWVNVSCLLVHVTFNIPRQDERRYSGRSPYIQPSTHKTLIVYMNIALRRFLHNQDNIATEGSPKPGLCPTLIVNDFIGFFIVHSTIGSTVHSMPLNSLKHYVYLYNIYTLLDQRRRRWSDVV